MATTPIQNRCWKLSKNKRTGTAVSLYLPYEVKYLHDIAKEDPNLICSQIYADALRAILGNIEPKHPLEVIRQNQKRKINELEEQLNHARNQLAMTEQRLPGEIARIFFLENVLGKEEHKEMSQLRTVLFFDSRGAHSNITVPLNSPDQMLDRYIQLVGQYEATKNGEQAISLESVNLTDRHPIELVQEGVKLCCNAEDPSIDCRNMTRDENGFSKLEESTTGKNLCDDLIYRCDSCFGVRQTDYKNKKLKPFWEMESLTQNQRIISAGLKKKSPGRDDSKEGILQRNERLLFESRRMALISYSKDQWATDNPEIAMEFEELNRERDAPLPHNDGITIPRWEGSRRWRGSRSRTLELMRTQHPDDYVMYQTKLQRWYELSQHQSEFIKSKISAWYENDCAWDEQISVVAIDEDVMKESQINIMGWDAKTITYVPSQREVLVALINDAKAIGLQL